MTPAIALQSFRGQNLKTLRLSNDVLLIDAIGSAFYRDGESESRTEPGGRASADG